MTPPGLRRLFNSHSPGQSPLAQALAGAGLVRFRALLIGPVSARVQGHYAPRRAAARAALIEALGSPRYAALLASLDRLAQDPPPGPQAAEPARDVLPAAVRSAYLQADSQMRNARHAPPGP